MGECSRSAKAILILTALRHQFRAVIAEPVAVEFDRWLTAETRSLPGVEAALLASGVEGWMARAHPERLPWPSPDELRTHAPLLAVVRHDNDMPAVVAAVFARPDRILSMNTAHWNADLAARTGLRVMHPSDFLAGLHP